MATQQVVFIGTPTAINAKQVADAAGAILGRHVTIQEVLAENETAGEKQSNQELLDKILVRNAS